MRFGECVNIGELSLQYKVPFLNHTFSINIKKLKFGAYYISKHLETSELFKLFVSILKQQTSQNYYSVKQKSNFSKNGSWFSAVQTFSKIDTLQNLIRFCNNFMFEQYIRLLNELSFLNGILLNVYYLYAHFLKICCVLRLSMFNPIALCS